MIFHSYVSLPEGTAPKLQARIVCVFPCEGLNKGFVVNHLILPDLECPGEKVCSWQKSLCHNALETSLLHQFIDFDGSINILQVNSTLLLTTPTCLSFINLAAQVAPATGLSDHPQWWHNRPVPVFLGPWFTDKCGRIQYPTKKICVFVQSTVNKEKNTHDLVVWQFNVVRCSHLAILGSFRP